MARKACMAASCNSHADGGGRPHSAPAAGRCAFPSVASIPAPSALSRSPVEAAMRCPRSPCRLRRLNRFWTVECGPPSCGGPSRHCAPLCGLGTIPEITRRSSTRRTPFRPPGKAVRCEPPPLPSATRPVRHPKAHPSSPETATGRKRRALVRAEPASMFVTCDPRPVWGRPGPRGPAASDPAGPRAVRRRARHVRRARPRPPGA